MHLCGFAAAIEVADHLIQVRVLAAYGGLGDAVRDLAIHGRGFAAYRGRCIAVRNDTMHCCDLEVHGQGGHGDVVRDLAMHGDAGGDVAIHGCDVPMDGAMDASYYYSPNPSCLRHSPVLHI